MTRDDLPCPCGSSLAHGRCCGPALSGFAPAATAEALMRSRYTAYVARDSAYILRTWHPSTRPAEVDCANQPDWRGLTIVRTERGREVDSEGLVEFVATGLVGDRPVRLREASRFVREAGQWLYVGGDIAGDGLQPETGGGKVGRNAPCPCGSGRKHKKCCGR